MPANTRTKRNDLDPQAVQTFYLSNAATQADQNELLTALRNVLDQTAKIFLVPSQNAIVERATPDQLLLTETLLNNLDRAKSEVVIDVAVLEVNRDKARNLGITLPQSISVTPQVNASTTTSSGSTTTGGQTSTNTTLPNINTFYNFTGDNLAVSIGSATVNALLNDSDTRILQNPRIRASDNQRAQLKIGQRIPIATGSYSSGASTAIVSSLVNTPVHLHRRRRHHRRHSDRAPGPRDHPQAQDGNLQPERLGHHLVRHRAHHRPAHRGAGDPAQRGRAVCPRRHPDPPGIEGIDGNAWSI